jgi:hypothetical protein
MQLLNMPEQVRARLVSIHMCCGFRDFFLENISLLSLCGNKLFKTFSEGC